MFVGHQALVNVGFGVARTRLANLVHGGLLVAASCEAYGKAVTGLAGAGPPGLVQVQARHLMTGDGSAVLALRWQAAGPGGALFPVLDADVRLASMGDQLAVLRLDGAYRSLPGIAGGGPDRAGLYRVATATTRDFLGRIAQAIADPAAAAPGSAAARTGPPRPPATDAP